MKFIPKRCLYVNIEGEIIKNSGMFWSGKSKESLAKLWNCKVENIKVTDDIQYNQNSFFVEGNKVYRMKYSKKVEYKIY